MNENIIDVFRSYPYATTETLQRVFYITATNDSLDTFLSMYVDSVSNVTIYCDCLFTSGFYEYYSRLVIDDIPPTDFDKTDYIQHLELNSSITTEDIAFLNSVIVEVYRTFPASSQENLQRGLTIVSNSDLLVPFLKDYLQAIEFIELDCSESGLSIIDINLENSITIFPNPIVDDFTISIDEEQTIKKLIVFDVTGKTIITKKIDGLNYIEMNNSNLESGIYFFKFSNGTNSTVKKVIVR
ncbi:T9SS type A sorting domain-containing protein [Psychroserpens damuponensis]|uniref:T9SS type A sorting domain-containing protein n=1 Tax=Psychroserpens damuponensis TaxID=943936 RepID=UPI00058B5CF2|nr:T9SS type A sorting domain-containing protein [Psychroserpens damuponensis]